MFIAGRSLFLTTKLRRSAIALLALVKSFAHGFAPNGAKIFTDALVAIDISLLWSENEHPCRTSKLNWRNLNSGFYCSTKL